MNKRVQEQYELWKKSELYPAEAQEDMEKAAFAAGFGWAIALRDAARDTVQITGPRLHYVANYLKEKRDALYDEADNTRDDSWFSKCSHAATAYAHAYRLIEPLQRREEQ